MGRGKGTMGTRSPAVTGRSVGELMKRGINPVGIHVTSITGKLGTVKAVVMEDCGGYSVVLDVRHFNGEPWDYQPWPHLVYVIPVNYERPNGSHI